MGLAYQQMREFYRDLLDAPAAVPAITDATPTNISIGARDIISITLENMPAGFTLNAVQVGGVDLAFPAKISDVLVRGEANAPERAGLVTVIFDTTESVVGSQTVNVLA